jgi:uncharacterized protein
MTPREHPWPYHRQLIAAAIYSVFEIPHFIVPSVHDSEQRYLAIGTLQGRFVTVVYTMRNGAIRIISFRRSRHEERKKYLAFFGK